MKKKDNKKSGALFATRVGVIATTVGSAVGLGNIWRFPFEAGENGGGAFLLCYVLFTLLVGVPLICAEFILGRGTRCNIIGAFRHLAPGTKWWMTGWIGVIGAILIPGFYAVVAGWTIEYFVQSLFGALDYEDVSGYHQHFDYFATGVWRPLLWTVIFLLLNFIILVKGARGIERSANIMMPVLAVLLITFCINGLTLDKASEGLYFLFHPDLSHVNSKMLLSAMGQSFFSLSIGLGTMTTYATYFKDKTSLGGNAVTTALLDTLVAILAGVIIFTALFSFGGEPAAGPRLAFEVLPDIFHRLPLGALWSALFFFLLILASLTSTVSMHETVIKFFTQDCGMNRMKATVVNCVIVLILAVLSCLSFGCLAGCKVFGMTFFNLFDYVSSNVILPLGGLLISLFVGWKIDRKLLVNQMTNNGALKNHFLGLLIFSLRWVAPLSIILIFVHSMGLI